MKFYIISKKDQNPDLISNFSGQQLRSLRILKQYFCIFPLPISWYLKALTHLVQIWAVQIFARMVSFFGGWISRYLDGLLWLWWVWNIPSRSPLEFIVRPRLTTTKLSSSKKNNTIFIFCSPIYSLLISFFYF